MVKYYGAVDSKGIHYDAKLDELFNKKQNGFFVELGAFNGVDYSNTAFFEYNRNWKGILIEPSLQCYQECIKNRPDSICINAACVSNEYNSYNILGDFNNMCMSSVDGLRLHSSSEKLISVPALTLENIFDKNNVKKIDFLSLDVEGYELNILKGINLNKYRPKYMLIEIYKNQYEGIINYLKELNYNMLYNFSEFNHNDNPGWDGTHQDYLFIDNL
jgi:FkbM family methyltransferase